MREMSHTPTSHWVLASINSNISDHSTPSIRNHHRKGGGPSGWRPALGAAQQSSSSSSPPAAGAGGSGGDRGGVVARPAVAFGADGRAGFGTCSTGARVTVGGALMAEQVRVRWTGRYVPLLAPGSQGVRVEQRGGEIYMLISGVQGILWSSGPELVKSSNSGPSLHPQVSG